MEISISVHSLKTNLNDRFALVASSGDEVDLESTNDSRDNPLQARPYSSNLLQQNHQLRHVLVAAAEEDMSTWASQGVFVDDFIEGDEGRASVLAKS